MVSKPHRNNSDFQLRYFLAGSCHTPDGAWCLLYGEKIDRQNVLDLQEAYSIRRKISKLEATEILESSAPEMQKLEAQAKLIELRASEETFNRNWQACRQELETICALMKELEPHCKYNNLSILERTEACQREEWKLELINRAENYMLTSGTIPADHFETMRQHPEFATAIVPAIKEISNLMLQENGKEKLLKHCETKKLLLEAK